MNVIPASSGSSDYSIARSLRTRAIASANLSQTITTSATWALSVWLKRGALSAISPIFGDAVKFLADNTLTAGSLTTVAVYRDPSSWYHIYVSNLGLYINGAFIGAVITSALTNPRIASNGTNYFDGELAEFNFINNATPVVTAFGSFDSLTGVWKPAKYSGSYPAGSSYLPFTDNSALTTSSNVGLGKDFSGNGNYWTTNNISITAGATYDSMTDVPTLTSQTAANFAVLDPLRSSAVLANGNLFSSPSLSSTAFACASIGLGIGNKFYFEGTSNFFEGMIGIASDFKAVKAYDYSSWGVIYVNGSPIQTVASYSYGDTIGVAWNGVEQTLTFYKNGVQQGTAISVDTSYSYIFSVTNFFENGGWDVNFGQRPFTYPPPAGFLALNTNNISAGSVTTSGTFVGNVSTAGPSINLNGVPTALTINGNAVTWGVHADKTAYGFKVRSSSTLYNSTGTNTYNVTTVGAVFKFANAQGNP